MARSRNSLFAAVPLLATLGGCCTSMCLRDIGPNTANGKSQSSNFTAGLTYDLAGDDRLLYALSLNAGVFRAQNGGPWIQLGKSPSLAARIVTDPNNPGHVFVGERNSDARPTRLVESGLWESSDAGDSWNLILEPARRTECSGDNLQAVTAILISPAGTVLAGTRCGVTRRSATALPDAFDWAASPSGVGAVTAFTSSIDSQGRALLWARGRRSADNRPVLFWSDNDGTTWNVVPFPMSVGGYGIPQSGVSDARGADETIAAFGDTAILMFRPDRTSDPAKWLDSRDNFCTLLYYSKASGTFSVQALHSIGNGTGLGGRLSLHAFPERPGEVAPIASGMARVHLFFNAAQVLYAGESLDAGGFVQWAEFAEAAWKGSVNPDPIHSDLWAVHRSAASGTVRLGNDGGVAYEVTTEVLPVKPGSTPRFRRRWFSQNDGLNTHHVHGLVTQPTEKTARIAYATTDNSEWFRKGDYYDYGPLTDWRSYGSLGDVSWVAADTLGPSAALVVRHSSVSVVTDFGEGLPTGAGIAAGAGLTLLCHPAPDNQQCRDFTELGARTFAVIQTGVGETPAPLLDAAMLVVPPLHYLSSAGVMPIAGGPLAGATSTTGGPLLIRNRKLLAAPDANKSQYVDWELVSDSVPLGAEALWVSGGHTQTVYYVFAPGPGGGAAWRLRPGDTAWSAVTEVGAPAIGPRHAGEPAQFGPLFVDPYDFRHIFAITEDGVRDEPAQGITVPVGMLVRDDALTAIVTKSGMFNLADATIGANVAGVSNATQATAFPKAAIAQVAFDPSNPGASVVAAPHAGLFFQSAPGQPWRDLTPRGRKMGMWATVAFGARRSIVFGTEGRSVWELTSYEGAPLACYFIRTEGGVALEASDGERVARARIEITQLSGTDSTRDTVWTGSAGEIPISGDANDVVRIAFAGNRWLAGCDTALVL